MEISLQDYKKVSDAPVDLQSGRDAHHVIRAEREKNDRLAVATLIGVRVTKAEAVEKDSHSFLSRM